ncbi:VOC family protein [Arthrobacter sp. AQ5-05]|uniref:VOC family protein n=1 Tax=Arthrobacter sp. AQ5-05 TaxID=2184581 RepID=UPI000DCB2C73|nr:VOC family protein [Arthrobacter sp. AQ5-05]RAX48581.1 VOC family protein [Arthrobacter sp. AQ5-05]
MLLDGVNHIAIISNDVGELGEFHRKVFDAQVGPPRNHGPGETMMNIRIAPGAELNVFVIDGNTEARRQTPRWGRGRIDHLGLAAASRPAFKTIRNRLIESGAGDGRINGFGSVPSMFYRDPDGFEGELPIPKE